jgi:hypothetical protein
MKEADPKRWPLFFIYKNQITGAMKSIPYILFALLLSLTSMAQTKDSTKNVTTKQEDGQLVKQPQPDLVKLKSIADIPPAVRQTLQKPKYKGWENAMVYKQKSTREYIVEIMENGKAKTYRFNENGEPLSKEDN